MSNVRLNLAIAISIGGVSLLAPVLAEAHFKLASPASWWSQLSDGTPQKAAPCGGEPASGTAATGMVTVFQPGQTVPVTVTATVAHPGWWRVSLKQGASSTQTAASFPDPPPLGAAGTAQQCTPAFMDNPVWSPTQPVIVDKLGLPAGSTSTTTSQSGTQTFNVTIPSNATCTSASPCALQVVMFMTDHPAGSCNYHHCADIAVAAGGGAGTGGTTSGSGDASGGSAGTGSGGGGCTVAGSVTPASALGIALAVAAFLRRRRPR